MTTKYLLGIGLNDKDSKVQEISTEDAKQTIIKVCGDCSIMEVLGAYTMQDTGEMVQEKSLRVELMFKQEYEVINYAKTLKKLLNQETIAFDVIESNSRLI